ncbi:variable surface lipoprotein [Mycoplasmopsis bovis]|uniref:variable surface lipoprotein n=1 Tax=Mycoplasmopsis bovis TaxID=28903 RepID=UPI001CFD80D3|nr:variable surface lipoprotein [Mycoplasmopsis bovis]UCP06631.1 variable surface lipoprotein [Mycoplasmopsis bovis]UTW25258.1 variable surface lipoprotein [Mycoplasmopsis bovis]
MKKSKFLLLGSVASLASIPFVAAKCGETKEEKKPEPDKNPGGDKNPGENKTPGENTDQGKNPGQNTDQGKNPETDTTPAKSTKIDLSKLESNIQDELSKLAKNDVSPEKVLNVLKKVKGLEKLTLLHFSTVEFKDNKLTVKAIEDSNLITGKYEFTTKPGPGTGTNSQQDAPTEKPSDKPADKPTEKPSDKPADRPTEKPSDKPADKPTDKPSDKPADKPTDKPSEKPSDKHADNRKRNEELLRRIKEFEKMHPSK